MALDPTTVLYASILLGVVIVLALHRFIASSSTNSSTKAREANSTKLVPKQWLGKLSLEHVATHNTEKDAWIIVDGKVYDVTEYVDLHPGGDAILRNVGADSSVGFHGPQHPSSASDILSRYLVGEI